jgi:hypothetical protein
MSQSLSHPRPPKEKKTIYGTIQSFTKDGVPMNATTIAKAVGVSRHRVLKYCKSHGIELDKLNAAIESGKTIPQVQTTIPQPATSKKKKKTAIQLAQPNQVKIVLGTPKSVKVQLD